ncbi:MAG: hypothetical protein JOZ78_04110 [Chroococcidiopsidaceae cyanobacterium CP_BM_ER_R8_30]|nr:hypothetical protein [Chroococcidiopsidaceae cyanobacterium CP_BM_ER_R8_30]
MLIPAGIVKTPSVGHLFKLWIERYSLDFSSPLFIQDSSVFRELVEASSPKGRSLTATHLSDDLIQSLCDLAGIETYSYLPRIMTLEEIGRLAQNSFRIYQKLVKIYAQHSPTTTSRTTAQLISRASAVALGSKRSSLSWWGLPTVVQLYSALEPILMEFQEQQLASRDWRTVGFLTTQLNFSNKLLLKQLSSPEQFLLSPYFKFIEEQVAIPWLRVCAAAAKHQIGSPVLVLAEKMLLACEEIAATVYHHLTQLFPEHRSRRGGLSHSDVAHSVLRDLVMFQVYIWLCVLEERLVPIEQELLSLYVMVMTGLEVKWELTQQGIQLLTDEILSHLESSQQHLLLPYISGIQQAFFNMRSRLGATS